MSNGSVSNQHDERHDGQQSEQPGAVVSVCDHTSVGAIIRDQADRVLLLERARFPWGWAPPAGHVDEHGSPEQAARDEVAEEAGLVVTGLSRVGGGWRANQCRRPSPDDRIGHEWDYFEARVTEKVAGQLAPSVEEARAGRWFAEAELQELADRTIAHAEGRVTEDEFAARPGLEPVWLTPLAELGLITATTGRLFLVGLLASGLLSGPNVTLIIDEAATTPADEADPIDPGQGRQVAEILRSGRGLVLAGVPATGKTSPAAVLAAAGGAGGRVEAGRPGRLASACRAVRTGWMWMWMWMRPGRVRQTGRDQVCCSGCARPGPVVAVTRPSRRSVWGLLTGRQGPWRAWCADCWPSRWRAVAARASVWLLPASYAGPWAGLDAVLGDVLANDVPAGDVHDGGLAGGAR